VLVTEGVWLITGAQASGKSTIAELLAQRFERAVHVRGGQFYRCVVRGWVPFDDPDRGEARRLLELRYRLSATVTDEYAAAGFVAIAQDNVYGTDVVRWLDRVRSRPRHLVVLRPSVSTLEARHEDRRKRSGKVAYGPTYTPTANDLDVAATPSRLGLWLDTSDWSPTETVDQIMKRSTEAVVP
jgi:chloramphenicol 3-O-phosphotransferase